MNPLHKYQKINRLQKDLSYLLQTIVEESTADSYDLMLVKQIKSKNESDISSYESCFLSYWRNKILYNMVDYSERDKELLNNIKKDSM